MSSKSFRRWSAIRVVRYGVAALAAIAVTGGGPDPGSGPTAGRRRIGRGRCGGRADHPVGARAGRPLRGPGERGLGPAGAGRAAVVVAAVQVGGRPLHLRPARPGRQRPLHVERPGLGHRRRGRDPPSARGRVQWEWQLTAEKEWPVARRAGGKAAARRADVLPGPDGRGPPGLHRRSRAQSGQDGLHLGGHAGQDGHGGLLDSAGRAVLRAGPARARSAACSTTRPSRSASWIRR